MSVEGQWRRARTPLSRRDRRLLAVTAGLAAVAVTAAAAVNATHPSGRSDAGCVVVKLASTMGGAEVRNCGAAAHTFCRSQGKIDRTVAAACRKQGFAADLR